MEDVAADTVVRVDLEEQDRAGGPPDTGKVATAARALLEDGVVVVRDAVDPRLLARLAERMTGDLDTLLRREERAENFAPGHVQQDPPADLDQLSPALLAHPFALAVCRQAVRQPVRLSAYSNNTNMPGSRPQPVHVDEGQRWPVLAEAHPPARLTVNTPLTATDAEHGAIELWPGTHRDTRMCQHAADPGEGVARALRYLRAAKRAQVEQRANRRVGLTVPEELLHERRAVRPPLQVGTEAGSLIIRDPRLWHRGMPNRSGRTRFMLATTYDPIWRRPEAPIELPRGAESLFDGTGLEVHAVWTDGPIDHLSRHRPPPNSPFRRPRPTGDPDE